MDLGKKESYNNVSKSDSKSNLEKLEKKSRNINFFKIGIILAILMIVFIILVLFFKSRFISEDSSVLLKINSAYVNSDNSSAVINLERSGVGSITRLDFNFYDFYSNSYLYYYDLEEGLLFSEETKSYLVDSSWIPDLESFLTLDYVSISYYYINSEGEEVSSTIRDSFGNSFFEDIRDPDNNLTSNPAPIQPRPSSGGGGGGGKKSSSGGGNENPGCSPDSLSVTCSNNKCGTQTNNCLAPVDCGLCSSSNSSVTFIFPTPADGIETANNYFITNTSIADSDLTSVIFNWNGINYTIFEDSIVTMYNFDNRSDLGENLSYVVDVSGNGNNGTVSGATFNSTGKYNGGYSFGGQGNFINATTFNWSAGQPITISLWVFARTQGIGNGQAIGFGGVTTAGREVDVYLPYSDNNLYWDYGSNNATGRILTSYVNYLNKWEYITLVSNGTGTGFQAIYINGSLVASKSTSMSTNVNLSSLTIGGGILSGFVSNFTGQIDELMIFNRVLSASEIRQLYFSNLYKYNSSQWYLYNNQSGLANGNYSYQVYAIDSINGINSSEKRNVNVNLVSVICNSNSNCGIQINSSLYCSFGNVYKNVSDPVCFNPGLPSSSCDRVNSSALVQPCGAGTTCSLGSCVAVACSSGANCPSNVSSGFICSGNNVNRTYLNYTCINPGLPSSSCNSINTSYFNISCPSDVNSSDYCRTANLSVVYYNLTDWGCSGAGNCSSVVTNNLMKLVCSPGQICSDGDCVTVNCNSNNDCPADGLLGLPFCFDGSVYTNNGDVYRTFRNYTCINPGTPQSFCNFIDTNQLNEICPDDINSSNYCRSFNLSNVYFNATDNYCVNGICDSNIIPNQIKQICASGQICSLGSCVPIGSEIQVSTCPQLQDMDKSLNSSYILINDIDCSATIGWNLGSGFKPIGSSITSFNGTFNGNGHTISNLYINRPGESFVGLFGYVNSSNISNVGLINVNISSSGNSIGGLVGYNTLGNITNSYSTGNVSGSLSSSFYVGKLVGYNTLGNINNSYSTGNVLGYQYVGGLIGINNLGNITNSYSTGNVTSSDYAGGLVGYNTFGNITNSYSTGEVNSSSYAGGLVGYHYRGLIINSYSSANVKIIITQAGGLVAYNAQGTISNSYATGNVGGGAFAMGGLMGSGLSPIILNSYWNNHPGNPNECYSGGNTGCTAINNNPAYFYAITNPPMNNWNFVNIWSNSRNLINYPILKWQEGQLPNIKSDLFERFINHLKKLFGYA